MKKKPIPFRNLSVKGWENLGAAALLIYYIMQVGFFLFDGNICKDYALDYCAYWSAGKQMNESRIADVYNLDLLAEFQEDTFTIANISFVSFNPVEVPYLPIFLIPFQLLSRIDLTVSFILWTLLNLIGLILYLNFFIKETFGDPLDFKLLLMALLSLPIFVNFQEGQVNIWLLICAGEFIRAILSEKQIRAGLWLGGWLLKPQLLVLILPILLIKRSTKILTGFTACTIAALVISLGLMNIEGFNNLKDIIFESAGGGATSSAASMMNWRMLGWYIALKSSSAIGWLTIILGSTLTLIATLSSFRKNITSGSSIKIIALLGLFAATNLVTWHAHIHMSIILIPPMIYLLKKGLFNKSFFLIWLFFPVIAEFFGYIFIVAAQLGNLTINNLQLRWFIRGVPFFILNLLILGWSIKKLNELKYQTSMDLY